MPGRERAKYLYRIARIIQERGRELAVLESIDNGKPIKESRDVDVPTVAAHFFYYAGWADKLEYAGFGTPAARRRRPDHPVELPAADAGLEDRPRAGLRQHRRAQAGRDHAADRAAVRRDLPAGRPAARASSTSSPAPARPAGAGRATPTSTRSRSPARPTSAARSRSPSPAPTRRPPSSSAARPPTSSSTTPPIDQAVEGIVNGIFFNQGHVCCAGSRLLVQESVADELLASLKRRMSTLRVGDPLDKNTDIGAINSAEQLGPDPRAVRHRRGRGRRALVAGVRAARARLLVPADALHRRHPGAPDRPRGDLRAGPLGADLPHPGRGGREGQQHAVRPVRGRLDREGLADPQDGQRSCAPAWSGPTRSTSSTRPARSAATRSRATAARAAGTAWRPTCDEADR